MPNKQQGDIELLTLAEVAKMLRVSQPTAQKLIDSGKLKASRVGRQQRIRKQDVEKYLQEN